MFGRYWGHGRLEVTYGTIGTGLMIWSLASMPPQWYWQAAALMVLAAVVTPFSIRLGDPIRLPAAMPIEMTVLLVAPAPVSILLAGWMALATSIYYRRSLTRSLFNLGNLTLPNALGATMLYLLIDPWPQTLAIPQHLPVVALAVLTRMLGNLTGTSLRISAEEHTGFWRTLKNAITVEVRSSGFTVRILPVLMAMAYPVGGFWTFILGAVAFAAVGASMQRYQERINSQTLVDGLTNLGNRKAWEHFRLSGLAAGRHLVAVVDINGLKLTNDTHGHEQGDKVIVDLARRLQTVASEIGRVFRIGGDEFALILPGSSMNSGALTEVEQAVAEYSRHWGSQQLPVSASVGFSDCPGDAPNLDAAVRLADQRMYQAKPYRANA